MKKFFIIFVFLSLLVACGSEKNENSSTTTNTTSEISQSKMLNYDFMIEQNIKTVKLQGDVPFFHLQFCKDNLISLVLP